MDLGALFALTTGSGVELRAAEAGKCAAVDIAGFAVAKRSRASISEERREKSQEALDFGRRESMAR